MKKEGMKKMNRAVCMMLTFVMLFTAMFSAVTVSAESFDNRTRGAVAPVLTYETYEFDHYSDPPGPKIVEKTMTATSDGTGGYEIKAAPSAGYTHYYADNTFFMGWKVKGDATNTALEFPLAITSNMQIEPIWGNVITSQNVEFQLMQTSDGSTRYSAEFTITIHPDYVGKVDRVNYLYSSGYVATAAADGLTYTFTYLGFKNLGHLPSASIRMPIYLYNNGSYVDSITLNTVTSPEAETVMTDMIVMGTDGKEHSTIKVPEGTNGFSKLLPTEMPYASGTIDKDTEGTHLDGWYVNWNGTPQSVIKWNGINQVLPGDTNIVATPKTGYGLVAYPMVGYDVTLEVKDLVPGYGKTAKDEIVLQTGFVTTDASQMIDANSLIKHLQAIDGKLTGEAIYIFEDESGTEYTHEEIQAMKFETEKTFTYIRTDKNPLPVVSELNIIHREVFDGTTHSVTQTDIESYFKLKGKTATDIVIDKTNNAQTNVENLNNSGAQIQSVADIGYKTVAYTAQVDGESVEGEIYLYVLPQTIIYHRTDTLYAIEGNDSYTATSGAQHAPGYWFGLHYSSGAPAGSANSSLYSFLSPHYNPTSGLTGYTNYYGGLSSSTNNNGMITYEDIDNSAIIGGGSAQLVYKKDVKLNELAVGIYPTSDILELEVSGTSASNYFLVTGSSPSSEFHIIEIEDAQFTTDYTSSIHTVTTSHSSLDEINNDFSVEEGYEVKFWNATSGQFDLDAIQLPNEHVGSYDLYYKVFAENSEDRESRSGQATFTYNIEPVEITITANSATKVSTATDPLFSATITGGTYYAGDEITFTTTRSNAGVNAVGTYDDVINALATGGSDLGNYTYVYVPGDFTITAPAVPVPIVLPPAPPVEVVPEPPVTIVDGEVPTTDTIEDDELPTASGLGGVSWSLFNALATIIGVAVGLLIAAKKRKEDENDYDDDQDERAKRAVRVGMIAVVLFFALNTVMFFLTQDLTTPMSIFDRWSIFFAVSSIAQMLFPTVQKIMKKDEQQVEA